MRHTHTTPQAEAYQLQDNARDLRKMPTRAYGVRKHIRDGLKNFSGDKRQIYFVHPSVPLGVWTCAKIYVSMKTGCAREEQFYRQMCKPNTKGGRLLLFYMDKNGKRVPNIVGRSSRQVAKTDRSHCG